MKRFLPLFALLTFLPATDARSEQTPPLPTAHVQRDIEGWIVHIDDRLLSDSHKALGDRALRILANRLYDIKLVVPAGRVARLQKVPIWIDYTHGKLRPAQYHPSAGWLKEHGYSEALVRAVHIPSAADFASTAHQRVQPWSVLHELAHAYHDQVLGFDHPGIRAAWARFRDGGKYKSTLHINGKKVPHYALTNPMEFFAEMTEAYFGQNDFFPFNRAELQHEEPAVYELLTELWGDGSPVRPGTAPPLRQPAAPSNAADTGRASTPRAPEVTAPPDSFFEKVRDRDREAARKFYKKFIEVKGLPVVASAEVADEALRRTHYLVTHLLAGRPDILQAMVQNGTRLIIIGKDQVYTDMPEYRNHPNPTYQNERVRGTGGFNVTSFGEENLLNLPLDRYDDESIAVHEFCHTIDAALGRIDPSWRERLVKTYRNALAKGLWKNAYASSNPAEYWAEICQSYFDCNRVNNWNHAAIGTREQLKQYDPEGYELVKTIFNLTPEKDWRYQPLRRQPSVIAPPPRLRIDPYYTKFTCAREFTVLGSKRVSDAALLRANDTIRKMFAYRHDILKAMIAEGARLVVLGRGEKLSDLPEFKGAKNPADFDEVRYLDYTPSLKLMVVPEENVLCLEGEPFAGKCMVIGVFARGLYHVTGLRPVDPDFERRRGKQQYELRVKRLDVAFDHRLQKCYEEAMNKGLWKGTMAARNRIEYWVAGVEAYFDATGDGLPPNLADRPITTRETLKSYDAGLFALVEETMAYKEHVDWRFVRNTPKLPNP